MSMPDFVGPIAVARSVDLDATGDTEISIPNGARPYRITKVLVTNASANLSGGSLEYGIFTAASAGGSAVVSDGVNSSTSLTAATKVVSPTVALTADTTTASTLYLNVSVANGSAATADVYLYGEVLA